MAMVEVSHAVVNPWTMVIHLEHTALTLPAMVCPGGLQPITAAKQSGGSFSGKRFEFLGKNWTFFTQYKHGVAKLRKFLYDLKLKKSHFSTKSG
jgi:hypothetical protein